MGGQSEAPATAADADHGDGPAAAPDLTPRQSQILSLMKAGKANKEIAAELGIGLGTVKQHINVLFRKLDVSNRTMAVLHGGGDAGTGSGGTAARAAAGGALLELRPAVVLSVTLTAAAMEHLTAPASASEGGLADDGGPEDGAGTALHRALASVASDFGAIPVSRPDGGDLILGVHRCLEHDVLRGIRAAFAAARGRTLAAVQESLRCGLDCGMIAVGVTAEGTWDGEIVAGPLLRRARDLAAAADGRHLALGEAAREMVAILCGTPPPPWQALDLGAEFVFAYGIPAAAHGLRGRAREVAILENDTEAAAAGTGRAILLEGEAGIGKSAVLAVLPDLCARNGLSLETWRCLPPDGQPLTPARGHLMNTADGSVLDLDALIARLAPAPEGDAARVVALDDLHWLPPKGVGRLLAALAAAAAHGRLVVAAARPVVSAGVGTIPDGRHLRLGRLDRPSVEILADSATARPLRREALAAICDRAGGVPLFAEQLARGVDDSGNPPLRPPLPLLSLLVSRLDGMHLDHRLLRLVTERPGARRVAALRQGWTGPEDAFDAALKAAVATGLLRRTERPEPTVSVVHPMIQSVLEFVMTTRESAGVYA